LGLSLQFGPEQANQRDVSKAVMKENAAPMLAGALLSPLVPLDELQRAVIVLRPQ